jgi:tRNA(fMet)-specific endonuclease VapC
MSYLLDTNVCVDLFKGHPKVCAKLADVSPEDCAISAVTAYELSVGVQRSIQPDRENKKLGNLLATIEVLPFDHAAGIEAAHVRHQLEQAGVMIGPYDILIAGQALASKRILISSNTREFDRIPQLELQNWRN